MSDDIMVMIRQADMRVFTFTTAPAATVGECRLVSACGLLLLCPACLQACLFGLTTTALQRKKPMLAGRLLCMTWTACISPHGTSTQTHASMPSQEQQQAELVQATLHVVARVVRCAVGDESAADLPLARRMLRVAWLLLRCAYGGDAARVEGDMRVGTCVDVNQPVLCRQLQLAHASKPA